MDVIDEALPAAPMEVEGVEVPWREAPEPPALSGDVGLAVEPERSALALADGSVVVVPGRPALRDARLVVHDAKAARVEADEDTLLLAYLIEPGRSTYVLDDLAAEYGVELRPEPAADEETAALVRHAAATRGSRRSSSPASSSAGWSRSTATSSCRSRSVLAAMEDAGVKIDTYRMGEITARLADRVEELEARAYELAGEEFMLGSTQQVARILFEKLELTAGRKGKTGYSTDTRVLRTIRGEHEIVAVIEEWREYSKLLNTYLAPAARA